jgi:nucleoside-specific outer membrane channel protein Tsx
MAYAIRKIEKALGGCALLMLLTPALASAQIFDFRSNEILLKYSDRYEIPFTGQDDREHGRVFTFQHADSWKYGDNFGFLDHDDLDKSGTDLYGEFYPNFSLGKVTGKDIGFSRIRDIGLLAGVNWGRDTKILKYLPGVRLSWDVPGLNFLNSDFTAYIDDNKGVDNGGVPKEDDSYMIDINWGSDFDIGNHGFSTEGHVEYIGKRRDEFDQRVSWWILAQPRLMYDFGRPFFGMQNHFFFGIEWNIWINKSGDKRTNENAPQLIFVGRF